MLLNDKIQIVSSSSVTVGKRVEEFLALHPSEVLLHLNQNLMNMPLPGKVIDGMKEAVDEITTPHGIMLDSPWDGYAALKARIAQRYAELGLTVPEADIFICGGKETAYSSLSDLFGADNNVILPDPCERVLLEVNQIAGRNIRFLKATPENNFKPMPDEAPADLVFLSNPSVVTGVCYTKEEMQRWVNWANENGAVIIYNSSLSDYLSAPEYPRSIYEIDGARSCAIEIFSFGEGYGVPELKIAYTLIPQGLVRNATPLIRLWCTRQHCNATPPTFVMQRAASLLLSPEAEEETGKIISRLKKVGMILSEGLKEANIAHVGEDTSPFLWAQCPKGFSSWQYFDLLLEKVHLVITPGSRFGSGGENFFRITSFGLPDEAREAMQRLNALHRDLLAEKADQNTEPTPAPIDIFAAPPSAPEPPQNEVL